MVRFTQQIVELSQVDDFVTKDLLYTLSIATTDLSTDLKVVLASPGANRFLLPIKSKRVLHSIQPDLPSLKRLCETHTSIGCFAYTMQDANPQYSALGRMFAPVIGVKEDIVNGNSAGCLGAYLLEEELIANPNTTELKLEVFQGMAFGSLGCVKVVARLENQSIRVFLVGSAYFAGEELAVL